MAKKTKKKKKDSELVQIQKLANASQEKIQQMINSANTLTAEFNASEAQKARDFTAQESSTAREYNAREAELARLFDSEEARKTREYNSLEAQKTRDYEKMMSDTSHQREVADLKAAGLNPVLSANSGAMSYTGASASSSPASGPAASTSALAGASASASFESGASAASSIMGNMLSGIANLFGVRTSAKASKYAADKSSSATRYAADQAAAATRYAADMAYRSVMDQPRGNALAVVDKYFGQGAKNYFQNKGVRNGLANLLKKGYNYALNSKFTDGLLHNMGVSLDGLNYTVKRRLRSSALDMFIYGSAVPFSKKAERKYFNALYTVRSFKRHRSGR